MPVEMRLWRIADDKLDPLTSTKLPSEDRLEEWLAGDLSMVADDLLIVGRQLASDLGGVLDMLAIDGNGDLAVLELKRDKTPRDVVAQALHYAAWVRTLSWEEIEQIGTQQHEGVPFATKFKEHFGQPPPDTINTAHRIYIIAAEMDAVSEAIVRYLSEEYSVTVNVVFFRYFREPDGREYLGRSWLMEPGEVEERGDDTRKRRRSLSLEELQRRADERGVGPQYQALFRFFSRHAKQTRRTRSNVAFAFRVDDQTRAVFSIYPDNSSAETGLWVDVRPDGLAVAFSVSEAAVREALPGPGEIDTYFAYGEIHHFRTTADVERLIAALSADATGDTADG